MQLSLEERFSHLTHQISFVDRSQDAASWSRLDSLTKPPRSLGRLEEVAVQIAAIQRTTSPRVTRKAIVVAAADHGVATEGVSPYPQEVTAQMVANFVAGGAAINQLADVAGAELVVLDVGVMSPTPDSPVVISRRVMAGTRNLHHGPAMTRDECLQALFHGADLAAELADEGADILATGEMGIANTTSASALVAAFTGAPVGSVTGPGTGLDDEGLSRKREVVSRAIEINEVDAKEPIDVLAALGGLEIAALAGVYLECARRNLPVVIDGFISASAALAAVRICPAAAGVQVASHLSTEPGHAVVLDALGLLAVLDLDMRLGEGSGAALCLPVIDAACKVMSDMATFDQAGVAESQGS